MRRAANPAMLSVRVSPDARALLEAAAKQARTNLSDFVRRNAVEAAEVELLDRRAVTIPAESWESFEAWLNAPAREIPNLRMLAATHPPWQD